MNAAQDLADLLDSDKGKGKGKAAGRFSKLPAIFLGQIAIVLEEWASPARSGDLAILRRVSRQYRKQTFDAGWQDVPVDGLILALVNAAGPRTLEA